MKKIIILVFILFSLFFAGRIFNVFSAPIDKSGTIEIKVRISVCGNGIKEMGEECDGSDLGGASCASLGYTGGTLKCSPSCTFDASACTTRGGGGGGIYVLPPETKVIFSGRAYPSSKIILLKDGQIAASVLADPNAAFNISLSGLSPGSYNFAIYSEDSAERRSPLITYPITLTLGATVTVTGIFIAPTIDVDKSEVRWGDNIAIFGQSVPNGEITIFVNSDKEFFDKTEADANGVYLYNFDTTEVDMGQHFTKSKAAKDGAISPFSKAVSFLVGTRNILKRAPKFLKGDLNDDGRVNLIDFSIAAYWYKRPLSPAFAQKETERLNGDGKIDLIDFSIMAFYWTG